jgi:hypothetical protein
MVMETGTIIALIGVGSLIVERIFSYAYSMKHFKSKCMDKDVIEIDQQNDDKK